MTGSPGPGALRLLAALLLGAGCGPLKLGRGQSKVVMEDFAEGRVVDVSITEKLTGSREMLFMSMPRKNEFLEGYIQGVITDYADNPVQGVVVRAVLAGEGGGEEGPRSAIAGSSFDPGVSDSNGFYRLRFSLPILDGKVDVRGRVLYNPGWEQERDNLGKSFEPQSKQGPFRLFYEKRRGRLVFSEGIRKAIVAPVGAGAAGRAAAPPAAGGKAAGGAEGAAPAAKAAEGKPGEAGGDEDIFKGFGLE